MTIHEPKDAILGIGISYRSEPFHVPYGPQTKDGALEDTFIDLRRHPEMIPVLPPCIGWPETQELLKHINRPPSHLMSLATDQQFTDEPHHGQPLTLASFVTLCFADVALNQKERLTGLAAFLKHTIDEVLQDVSNSLQLPLHLDILIEIQPTLFHLHECEGWSLTIAFAASGEEHHTIRGTWGWGIQALMDGLTSYQSSHSS